MKFAILLDILFDLLLKRRVTATELANKYEISPRTVYRYIDLMSATVPVYVKQGRNGGICISDSYKLPMGFMKKEEYEAAMEALAAMYSQLPQERFLQAKRKLSAQTKTEIRDMAFSVDVGSILVDGGSWGDTRAFSEKLKLFEECIKEKAVMEIVYYSRKGEKSTRKIEPHVLIFKQSVWYTYAFCYKQRAFRLFRIGRVYSCVKTTERFQKRPFSREDIPLSYWTSETPSIEAKFEIAENAFADAQDWLGSENFRKENEKWIATVTLPDDEGLVRKILGLGGGIKVLSPARLKERVAEAAEEIAQAYRR